MVTKVAIVKGDDRLQNIIEALKLIQKEISPLINNKKVLLKPNILLTSTDRPLAVTHIDAVRAVLQSVATLNPAQIIIGEGSAGEDTLDGFRNFGYFELAQQFSVSFVDFNRDGYREYPLLLAEGGEALAKISRTVLDADCRISIVQPKCHHDAIVSLSIKNMMGCLPEEKWRVHGAPQNFQTTPCIRTIHKNLLRLVRIIPPHIAVLDGFSPMQGHGPFDGDAVDLRIVVASTDPMAADAVMAKIMGFDPEEIGYLYYARREGIGETDLDRIEIVGNKIEDVKKEFGWPPKFNLLRQWKE